MKNNYYKIWIRVSKQFALCICLCLSIGVLAQPKTIETDTRSRPIDTFMGKTFLFKKLGLHILANFPSARLNEVEQKNDSTFLLTIRAENYPINPSPWYAFKVISERNRSYYFHLNYVKAHHRYHPKYSRDGKNWTAVDSNYVQFFFAPKEDNDKQPKVKSISMKLSVSKDTLWVAAQPIQSSADVHAYIERQSKHPFVHSFVIGKTTLGRDMTAFEIGKPKENKPMFLFISRQHPPEVTGYDALRYFLEVVLGNSQKAKWFQNQFYTVVVPLMNPDGADLGHWRHNVGGIDLNRDWTNQHQVETLQVVAHIKKLQQQHNAPLLGTMDFHSTHFDVFYINKTYEDMKTTMPNFVKDVLVRMQKKLPFKKLRIQPTKIENPGVSKNFFRNEFRSESIVCETSDTAEKALTKKKAIYLAKSFLEELFKRFGKN